MKKFANILLAVAALSFAAVSCVKEEVHEPGEQDVAGCYGVYFPTQDASGAHTYEPSDPTIIDITVARTNTKGAINVPFILTVSEDVFSAEDIVFADGQSETTVEVSFPGIKQGQTYSFTMQVADPQYVSQYATGATSIDFSVIQVQWEYVLNPVTGEKALVDFDQDWWGESAQGYIKYYEVDGRRYAQTETIPESHVSNGEAYTGYGFFGQDKDEASAEELSFVWYTELRNSLGYTGIEVDQQPAWVSDGEQIYRGDAWAYYCAAGSLPTSSNPDFETFFANYGDVDGSYPCSYFDEDQGIFYIYSLGFYTAEFSGWWPQTYTDMLYVDGYTRVDYSVDLEADYSYDGMVPVAFEVGADVAEVRYKIYDGSLTATQLEKAVAEITEDGAAGYQTVDQFEDGYTYVELTLDQTGDYTIVAVPYDEDGNAQVDNAASLAFEYISADDDDEYSVDLKIGTEDTPERYSDNGAYDTTNSFLFWMVGSDLTEVHVMVTTTAKVDADMEAAYNYVKYDVDPVKEQTLADINDLGGYADLIYNASAVTSYTVVVWATNGHKEKFMTAEYTTSGLDNVLINKDGAFGFYNLFYDYDEDTDTYSPYYQTMDLEYNPNTGYYELCDWGVGVQFKFTINDDNTVDVPVQTTGYASSTGTWYVGSPANFTADGTEGYYPYNWVSYGESMGYEMSGESKYDPESGIISFFLMYVSDYGYVCWPDYESYYYNGVPNTLASTRHSAPSQYSVRMPARKVSEGIMGHKNCEAGPHAASFKVAAGAAPVMKTSPKDKPMTMSPSKRIAF